MNVILKTIPPFNKDLKRLSKKYKSLKQDFKEFLISLNANPFMGIDLGGGVHKIRLAITSKGKGKSGGARVITYSVTQDAPDECQVTFLSIYDKGEIENLTDTYIQSLVERAK